MWFFQYWAPSQTIGRVYSLLVQLLPNLASAVTLGSKFRRNRDHILLSHLRLSPLFVAYLASRAVLSSRKLVS
jgi:hypothetical protein